MSSLQDLRNHLDAIDQEIVLWLVSQAGEKTLGDMIDERLQIVRQIGTYKKLYQLPIIDPERQKVMIQSRVSWAPESCKELVKNFFEILHDIAVMIQQDVVKKG